MKFIAYYRVSKLSESGKERKEKGEASLGIEAQKFIVRNYYGDAVLKEFTEVKSAKDMNRPVLQQAIAECLSTGAVLVVAKLDRLSRKVEDALAVYEQVSQRLVSCDIPNLDKFTLSLFAAFAERERTLIQLRIKSALSAKKEREGKRVFKPHENNKSFLNGTVAAIGRRIHSENAKSNPNNIRAGQMILAWREQGFSWEDIVGKLNENEFRTSRGLRFSRPNQASRLVGRYNTLPASLERAG